MVQWRLILYDVFLVISISGFIKADDRIVVQPQVTTSELASLYVACTPADDNLAEVAEYEWSKVGDDTFEVQQTSALQISPVMVATAGVYICKLTIPGQWVAQDSTEVIVEYLPRWPTHIPNKFAAAAGATALLRCEVLAHPAVNFQWTFDQQPLGNHRDSALVSEYQVYNVQEGDYGMYRCKASNSRGENTFDLELQRPGPPDEPLLCTLYNISNYDVVISCVPGFNGGAPVTFAIQKSGSYVTPRFLISTTTWVSDEEVHIRGQGLYPNVTYLLHVYAENEFGRSTSSYTVVAVSAEGPFVPVFPPEESEEDHELYYIIGGVVGGVLLLVIIIAISISCCRRRKSTPSSTPMAAPKDEQEENKFNRDLERQSMRDRREYFGSPSAVPPTIKTSQPNSNFERSHDRRRSSGKLRSSFGAGWLRRSFGRQPRQPPPPLYGTDYGGTSYEEFERQCDSSRAYAIQLQGFDSGETSDYAYQNKGYQGSRDCLESAFMNPNRPDPLRKMPSYRGYVMGNTHAYNDAQALSTAQPSLAGVGALSAFPLLNTRDPHVHPSQAPGPTAGPPPSRPVRPILTPVAPPDVPSRPLVAFPSVSSINKPTVTVSPFSTSAQRQQDHTPPSQPEPVPRRPYSQDRTPPTQPEPIPRRPYSQEHSPPTQPDFIPRRQYSQEHTPPSHPEAFPKRPHSQSLLRVSADDLLKLDDMFGSTDNLNRSDPYGGHDPFEGVDSFLTPARGDRGSSYSLPDDFWEFSPEKLYIRQKIGDGVMGEVWRARAEGICGRPGQTVVAVKMLKDDYTEEEQRALLRELSVMKALQPHPNIIALMGCCTKREPVYLILEYAARGTLQTLLRSYRLPWTASPPDKYSPYANLPPMRKLTYRDLLAFAQQAASGMDYIASRDLLHRDLSARNVLVDEEYVCKIADFGFARDVAQSRQYESRTQKRLPLRWMSPEALFDCIYTTKSDVWAFGIVLWEIVTLGSSPYPGVTGAEVMEMVQGGYRMQKPQLCTDQLYVLMRECWMNDPRQRPGFPELKQRLTLQLRQSLEDHIFVDEMTDNFYEILENVPGEKC